MSRIAIIGLGLIGGSLGLALKRASPRELEIVGYARRPETASRAMELGAVDGAKESLSSSVEGAELVIVATPVMAIRDIFQEIAPHLPRGSVVTDTASTKAMVMKWAAECLPSGVGFIGGHPMAGKETSGIDAADPDLFRGAVYCLVPDSNAPVEATELVKGLVGQIGARTLILDAEEHDRLLAGISHLPILLSAALVSATTKSPLWPRMSQLAATGYRDLSRLASGNPRMGRDICLTNRDNILYWIDEYIRELGELRSLVANGDAGLEEALIEAMEARRVWLQERE